MPVLSVEPPALVLLLEHKHTLTSHMLLAIYDLRSCCILSGSRTVLAYSGSIQSLGGQQEHSHFTLSIRIYRELGNGRTIGHHVHRRSTNSDIILKFSTVGNQWRLVLDHRLIRRFTR